MEKRRLDLRKYKAGLIELASDLALFRKAIDEGKVIETFRSLGAGEFERISDLDEKYLGCIPSRLGLNYFFPTSVEWAVIDRFVESSLEDSKKEFHVLCKSSALSLEELRARKLAELDYNFRFFYEEGEPIQMFTMDRADVTIKFFMDLYKFEFIEYLNTLGDNSINTLDDGSISKLNRDVVSNEEFIRGIMRNIGVLDASNRLMISHEKGGSSVMNGVVEGLFGSRYLPAGMSKKGAFEYLSNLVGYKGKMPKDITEISKNVSKKVKGLVNVG